MKYTLKGVLKIEKDTIVILKWIAVITLLISAFLELGLKAMLGETLSVSWHIDYMINIMLGVAASSFVSVIGIIFSFEHKKNQQIQNIVTRLKDIFMRYLDILASINAPVCDDGYFFENTLQKEIESLERDIRETLLEYDKADFTSDVIEETKELLNKKLTKNLLVIKSLLSMILFYEKYEKDKNKGDAANPFQQIKRDIITKRADSESYQKLYEILERNFSRKEVEDAFDRIGGRGTRYEHAKHSLEDLKATFEEAADQRLEFGLTCEIQMLILDLRSKHEAVYAKECTELNERIKKAIEKMKEKKNKEACEILQNIYDKMREDKMDEARELINSLETIAERGV